MRLFCAVRAQSNFMSTMRNIASWLKKKKRNEMTPCLFHSLAERQRLLQSECQLWVHY